MSERKVLNKYYPPDFDPSKIPKLRLPRNRQYSIRIMSPFNMRCNTCGEYIYKGKKFNSRKETVEDEEYLGLKIFRFYIKCPRCVAEIAFKTDPENTDYALEGGATRNFEAAKTAEVLAKKEMEEKEQEELNNPMKVLENRTKASQQEMEMIETLEELRELNSRHAKVDHIHMVKLHKAYEEQLAKLQDEEDEKFIRDVFGKGANQESVKRLQDDDVDEDNDDLFPPPVKKAAINQKPTDFLTQCSESSKKSTTSADSTVRKVGSFSSKSALAGLVRRKTPATVSSTSVTSTSSTNTHPDCKSNTNQTNISCTDSKQTADNRKDNVSNSNVKASSSNSTAVNGETKPAAPSGLGLLGAYSDSESNSDSN